MITLTAFGPQKLLQHFSRSAGACSTIFALVAIAALSSPQRAAAGPFAATYFSPNSQIDSVGTPSSVDVIFAVGTAQYGSTFGLEAWIAFNPNILQITSVTNGQFSPFTTVSINTFNNSLGTLQYKALGGNVSNTTFTAFTINFTPVMAGTSPLDILNVNQYFSGFGPFGVNGSATDGSVTVIGGSSASVPDASSSLVMVCGGILVLAGLRRRLSFT